MWLIEEIQSELYLFHKATPRFRATVIRATAAAQHPMREDDPIQFQCVDGTLLTRFTFFDPEPENPRTLFKLLHQAEEAIRLYDQAGDPIRH